MTVWMDVRGGANGVVGGVEKRQHGQTLVAPAVLWVDMMAT